MGNEVTIPVVGKKSAEEVGDIRGYSSFRNGALNSPSTGNKEETDKKKIEENKKNSKARSFSLKDYNWSDEYNPSAISDLSLLPIQTMTLTEFQPEFVFQWGKTNDMKVAVIEKGIDMLGTVGALAKQVGEVALYAGATSKNNDTQNEYKNNPGKVVGLPIDFVKKLFAGTYINSFQIPFFNDTYLKANTIGNWSAGGAAQALGEKAAEIVKQSMNIDFPTTPTWQISDTATRDDITVEYYLINNTTDNLNRNFRFLNSIISGAYWVQMDYVQKSPNVYDVVVPGRFHIYFAAIAVEITHVGKLRTNSSISTSNPTVKSINTETLFPDSYKIQIIIKDLSPNNFNNYVDYLMNGADSQVTVGQNKESYDFKYTAEDIVVNQVGGAVARGGR